MVEIQAWSESRGVKGYGLKVYGPESNVAIDPCFNPYRDKGDSFKEDKDLLFNELMEGTVDTVLISHNHQDHIGLLERCIEKAGLMDNIPDETDESRFGFITNSRVNWIDVKPPKQKKEEMNDIKEFPLHGGDAVTRVRMPHGTYGGDTWEGVYMNGYFLEMDDVTIGYTADIHGMYPSDKLDILRDYEPDVLVMDGPSASKASEEAKERAFSSAREILKAVHPDSHVIVDHHATRHDPEANEVLSQMREIGDNVGFRGEIKRAADLPSSGLEVA